MFKFLPRFFGAMLGWWLAHAGAAELRLPPIAGEFEGVLTRFALPGAPELRWRLVAKPAGDGRRDFTMTMDGAGTSLRVTAHMAPNGEGTWQIEEARVDAGTWLTVLAPQFAPSLAGAVAGGTVSVTGGGSLRQGQPAGKIKVELSGGTLRHPDQGWSLDGVTLQGEFSFDAAGPHWASVGPMELTVRTITTTRMGARNLSISAAIDDRLIVALAAGRIEVAGGDVVIEPCTIPLSPPVVNVRLKINRVGLQDIVALVPAGLADARGRIDGDVRLSWSEADNFQIGAGHLALRDDEATTVRLAPAPGFLTERVPRRFALLPPSAGALARWLSPVNPAYADLSAIELGETDLQVESLSVEMTPDGDGQGRSASVRIKARPAQKNSTVGLVTFDVNVSGPLSAVLRLGLQEGVSLQVH